MPPRRAVDFWPRRPKVAAILAGKPPAGHDDGAYDVDGLDETGEHWCNLDGNAVEVAWANAMGECFTVYVRPTLRGLQWAIAIPDGDVLPLDPEYTRAPISGRAIVEAMREHGLHTKAEYRDEDVLDEVDVGSDFYELRW